MTPKILLADDHPIVGLSLYTLAKEAQMDVVEQIRNSSQIVPSIENHRPQILITEVRLGRQDALKSLEKIDPELNLKVIVFTSHSNPTNIARASALGCFEFIQKTSPIENLLIALRGASAGEATPPTSLLATTKTRMKRIGSGPAESPLTKRESQVLQHVAMGLSNREIGKSLGISVETVKEHVQNILRKLDVNDRTQAAVWALKNGMI
ncbi:MAG: response regulator transcription factor [Planctomycetaceae bacterium]|nr:response regulator transcription factor [Planctomycetaceae bacterium]MCP4477622.1 response regulator transcription factor [Planctomycetaceae bacterium]MCP4778138.1 response regulator transcription factor [Planctomycetaceae bacterium]